MEDRGHDIACAFGRDDFRVWVDTLYETLGLSLTVVETPGGHVVLSGPRSPYCDLLVGGACEAPSPECFDSAPVVDPAGRARAFCRGGLPCYFAPVVLGGRTECYVMLAGFVTSTRERRRLFELLVGRGIAEADARVGLRDIPVYSHGRAERFAQMVAAHAVAILEAERAGEMTADRIRRLEDLLATGRVFADDDVDPDDLCDALLDRAMVMLGADDGALMLLRPGSDILEVAAARGDRADEESAGIIRVGEGLAGRVAESGRSEMLAESGAEVCVPLTRGGAVKGTLRLGFSDPGRRLSTRDLEGLEQYAAIAASGIDRATNRVDHERELVELLHVNEFSRMLQGDMGADELLAVSASVLEKSLEFGIGGVVFTGHSRERATVVVRADVSQGDVDSVFDEACGLGLDECASSALVTHLGSVSEDPAVTAEWTVLSVPLAVRDIGVGYVFVAGVGPRAFDAASERLMWRLASHIAPAFDRAVLFERLAGDYARTIAALSATLDANEHRESGHSARVMDYSMAIGEEMGLDREQIEILRFAGLLHDIGKVGVSEDILLKPSTLTDDEMAEARRHSQLGASLVEQVDFLNAIAPVIMHHHERWDGKGYPMRLAGEAAPLLARILAVADSYDSMTAAAPYRAALSSAEARAEIEAGSGTQFDPRVVAALFSVLDRQIATGMSGMLSEAGRRGWLPA